jgi:hypothetical protein
MRISVDQLKHGVDIVGGCIALVPSVVALVPEVVEWTGKYHLQLFQAGIIHDHKWVIAFPTIITIAGFGIMLRPARSLWILLLIAFLAAVIAVVIFEIERETHSLSIYILLIGWSAWTTFLSLITLSIASLIKIMIISPE